MSETTKTPSEYDQQQIFQRAYNKEGGSLTTDGFVVGKVGRRIVRSVISGTVDDYSYYDSTTLLYTLRITYNNTDHDEVNEVERTA